MTYFNLILVMLLGWLWHGANWTFLVWGAYHGSLLAFERWRGKQSVYERLPHFARIALTFVLVLFSWVLFRSPDLTHAISYLSAMFGAARPGAASVLLSSEIYTPFHLGILMICAALSFQRAAVYDFVDSLTPAQAVALAPLFLLAIGAMFSQAFN